MALEGGEVSANAPAALYARERPGTHCTGGWVGPRAGLDRCGKSRPHWDSIPGPEFHKHAEKCVLEFQEIFFFIRNGLIAPIAQKPPIQFVLVVEGL